MGALNVLKIYIEDRYIPEIYINGVPCRKIGTVKNGATETFKIPNKTLKVFAIWNKTTRNISNDYYELPEGEADVFLSGRATSNLLRFNPFKFDGNENTEGEELRSKAFKKSVLALALVVVGVFLVFGIVRAGVFDSWVDPDRPIYDDVPEWDETAQSEDFKVDDFQITLNKNFAVSSGDGYVAVLESSRVTVFLVRETFERFPQFKDITREEYMQKLIDANKDKIKSHEVIDDGTLYGFLSTRLGAMGEEYTVYSYIYKTDTAFWFVQFKVLSTYVEEFEPHVLQWAKSIQFNEFNK